MHVEVLRQAMHCRVSLCWQSVQGDDLPWLKQMIYSFRLGCTWQSGKLILNMRVYTPSNPKPLVLLYFPMQRQPFTKKDKSIHSSALYSCQTPHPHGTHHPRKLTIHPSLNIYTPQKDQSQDRSGDNREPSNYSEYDRVWRLRLDRRENQSVAENISEYMESSDGRSELSVNLKFQRDDSGSTREQYSRRQVIYPLIRNTRKVFLIPKRFRDDFVQLCEEQLEARCKGLGIKEHWGLEKLFSMLSAIEASHPFAEREPSEWKGLETLQGLLDRWIFDREQHKNLVFSFDFAFSHIGLVLIVVFYWMRFQDCQPNPLLSRKQLATVERQRYSAMGSILQILHSYVVHRSREYRNNMVVVKLLDEFYDYVKGKLAKGCERDLKLYGMCQRTHQKMADQLRYEIIIVSRLEDGKDCAPSHLHQIYKNYTQKDKMIRDLASDIAEVFGSLSKRSFMNCPLSRYYQTGQQDLQKSQIGQRFTTMSCWLMNLVLAKIKNSRNQGWSAMDYIFRYVELCKIFFEKRDFENLVLFGSVLLNLRQDLPSLWAKCKEKKGWEGMETEVDQLLSQAENMTFHVRRSEREPIVHSWIKIFKIIDTQKERFREKDQTMVNMNFHEVIQQCARKIVHFRNLLELRVLQDPSNNKTIKVNLNYRFLYHELYVILNEEGKYGNKEYSRYREDVKKVSAELYFPFNLFYLF